MTYLSTIRLVCNLDVGASWCQSNMSKIKFGKYFIMFNLGPTNLIGAFDFSGKNPLSFFFEDLALDGMNSIHITAKYNPNALKLILDFMQKTSQLVKTGFNRFHEVVMAKNEQLKMSPLHIAADSKVSTPTRLVETTSVTRKKSPKVYKSYPKIFSLEK